MAENRPGSNSNPMVTLIVINFNGLRYLAELFEGLESQTFQDFRVILVDNNSTDGSPDFVQIHFPSVSVLRLPTNLGFGQAANLAAKQSESRFIAFLNTDLKLKPDWLENLLAPLGEDPRLAATASKMLLYDRPHLINGVGGVMNYIGYTWDRGMMEEDCGQFDEPAEVLFAPAAAALYKRSAFDAAGGFDNRFFMYHEDVDLGWRVWLLGYRIRTAPDAVVYHHFGGSTKAARSMLWREVLGERNSIRSLVKNYEVGNALRVLRDLALLKQRWPRKLAQLRNFLWNLLYIPETIQLRQVIQKHRRISDDELKSLIVQSRNVPVRL